MSELAKLARAKWRSSGLTDDQAKRLKLAPVVYGVKALRIPYFDERGRPTKFFRLRYLEEVWEVDVKGKRKLRRFHQPADVLNEVYLPPLTKRPWVDVLSDPAQGLIITEGELKSACACARGLYAVGLGGVDLWQSGPREVSFLPQLEAVEWQGRDVTIVFDSDAADNPNVTRAQHRLGGQLLRRGARPRIATLPPRPKLPAGKNKQGLDDYLMAFGADRLRSDVLSPDKSEPLEGATALWKMNEGYVYVDDPGVVVNRATHFKMKPGNFVNHHAANLQHVDHTRAKPEKVSTAQAWLEWPYRFQADRLIYSPGRGELVDGAFNLWKGLGVEPKEGSVNPWSDLLDHLFRDVDGKVMKAERDDFERWCAYPLQHPGAKLYTCFVLWGLAHGTGKTLAGYILQDVYGENGIEIKDHSLKGNFNTWADGKQFVLGDEVTGDEGGRRTADRLKGFITQERMLVNTKNVPEYRIDDCINYLFTSNHRDAFFIDPKDRRFRVHEVKSDKADPEFYRRVDRWRRKENGPAKLLRHLLDLDLGDFDPKAQAPETSSKLDMIEDGRSDLARWAHEFVEDPAAALGVRYATLGPRIPYCQLFAASELLGVYRDSDPDGGARRVSRVGLGKELKNAGLAAVNGGLPVRTQAGLRRLYAVADVARWTKAGHDELAKHRNAFFDAGGKPIDDEGRPSGSGSAADLKAKYDAVLAKRMKR